jgi:hypothetical protein
MHRPALLGLLLAMTANMAAAHEHHEDEIPDGSGISAEPLVSVCWEWKKEIDT